MFSLMTRYEREIAYFMMGILYVLIAELYW